MKINIASILAEKDNIDLIISSQCSDVFLSMFLNTMEKYAIN